MRPTDVLLYGSDSFRQPAPRLHYPPTRAIYREERRLQPLSRSQPRAGDAGLDWQRLWIDLGGEG
jgi:hypothetical protein